ncbi:hypothetical protein H3S87_07405 [Bifidobacterium sp. W8108]|uniref:hypothetical protein n=1 Tax=unclassified Bifidobacterium TaxID=2608897 RepID=UPI0018DC2370|nr:MULTISPECIES: hypothetical protein [unclassified Bifidobacterium]MBH9979471.1 hypothetical protein [Bifidobacterium sp. W8108]MBI0174173.1 hypothetical protein [Bifidobacterium sp. M0307]
MNYDQGKTMIDDSDKWTAQAVREVVGSLTEKIRRDMAAWDQVIALGEIKGQGVIANRSSVYDTLEEITGKIDRTIRDRPEVMKQVVEQYFVGRRDRIDEIKRAYQTALDNDPQRIQSLTDWATTDSDFLGIAEAVTHDGLMKDRTIYLAAFVPPANEWMQDAAKKYVGTDGPEPGGRPFTQAEIEIAAQRMLSRTVQDDSLIKAVMDGFQRAREDKDLLLRKKYDEINAREQEQKELEIYRDYDPDFAMEPMNM